MVPLDQPLASAIELLERTMIQHSLKATRGLLEPAAKKLGISRKGLYLKRHRFGLES
jgi:DNA-binding NtrC family response regulator